MSTYQVRTLEEADQIMREHERKTKTLYALLRSTTNFGCVDVPDCTNDDNEVRFETVGVPYCGAPFYVAGLKILQCQSFKGRGPKKKKMDKKDMTTTGPLSGIFVTEGCMQKSNKKSKSTGRSNHKLRCTATVIMKEVIYYPEFQVTDHSKNNRIAVARHLKDILKSKAQVQKDRIIYITVPGPMDHFGHSLVTNVTSNVKRLYIKNDFYGDSQPCNSKRIYHPIKQEKVNFSQLTKKLNVDEDDSEAKAKEVREVLQSIMALTYKPGTFSAYDSLLKDLHEARQNYQHTIDTLLLTNEKSPSTKATISSTVSTAAILPIQTSSLKGGEWQRPLGNQTTSTQVNSNTATVLAVATLPLTNATAHHSNTITLQQQPVAHNSNESTSQETSIFLEAMEAIFNPQM